MEFRISLLAELGRILPHCPHPHVEDPRLPLLVVLRGGQSAAPAAPARARPGSARGCGATPPRVYRLHFNRYRAADLTYTVAIGTEVSLGTVAENNPVPIKNKLFGKGAGGRKETAEKHLPLYWLISRGLGRLINA